MNLRRVATRRSRSAGRSCRRLSSFVICSGSIGCCRISRPERKSQDLLGAHRLLADVAHAVREDAAAAFRAGAERLLVAEVDRLGVLVVVVALAEVELELVFVGDLEDRGERAAPSCCESRSAGRSTLSRSSVSTSGDLELAAARDLGDREVALRAGKAPVVLLDHAAAVRARRRERGIVARARCRIHIPRPFDDLARSSRRSRA